MASVQFTDVQARPTEFLDFTSVTLDEFQLLVPPFEAAFQAHMREWRLDGKPRAVRSFPSIRHVAILPWNAASKGETSCCNLSSVTLVQSRNAIGRDCSSANRKSVIGRASRHCLVLSEAHHTRKKAG